MAIYDLTSSFAGFQIDDWLADNPAPLDPKKAYRIKLDYDQSEEGVTWPDLFFQFLENSEAKEISALVVGAWDGLFDGGGAEGAESIVAALVSAHERLPNLKALFIGDITAEECEISWINQTDLSPLLLAFPKLEHFGARGGQGLSFGRIAHQALKSLAVETGGLPGEVLREIVNADLPELEHLEIWLGDDNYGWTGSIEDLEPVLSGRNFPRLTYLGLRDSCIADDIAQAVASAPILDRIKVLDLSLGTMTDEGGAALFASEKVRKLEKLDLHHHYLSPEMMAKLNGLGIEVDLDDSNEPDDEYRYVAVGE